MPIEPGRTLLHYRIVDKLGEGGMGAVWRAVDESLDREVAIKTLPEDFARDPERLARFEREARLLASLNHTNIATIHGMHEADGVRFLAMEIVAGEDLTERIARGPLPVEEALSLARQIANALATAHASGVIHRDLKPANVRVTSRGEVKVLDFGLAKALEPSATATADASSSPTMTSSGTVAGMILGTAAYMSPEQARGQVVDRRADIWSFGCVLYEMLTGRQTFSGATVSDMLASVLRAAPDWQALPPATPDPIRRLLRRCLAKDPERRLHDIADARIEIDEVDSAPPSVEPRPSRLPWMPIAAVALVAALIGVAGGWWISQRESATAIAPTATFKRLTHSRGMMRAARFAPDGQTIVYGAAWGGPPVRLYLARADAPDATPVTVPPAELLSISSAGEMAVSLGHHYTGWMGEGTLARASLLGGNPREVLERVRAADWSPDGTELAIVRRVDGFDRLEYPVGTVLDRTAGYFADVRVSPDGSRVAYADHPVYSDDLGHLAVVDRSGNKTTLQEGLDSIRGVAWAAGGREIWFTSSREGNYDLGATDLTGRSRIVYRSVSGIELFDVAADGRALLARQSSERQCQALLAGFSAPRSLIVPGESSMTRGPARDGRAILVANQETADYETYLVRSDRPGATRLSTGDAMGISPQGDLALALSADLTSLLISPLGVGQTREVPNPDGLRYESQPAWLPDGKRLVVPARRGNDESRACVIDVASGACEPFGAPGVFWDYYGIPPVSPDGRFVVLQDAAGVPRRWPVAGGDPLPIPGLGERDLPLAWTDDGDALYVGSDTVPVEIVRLDLETGERTPWTTISPTDTAGLRIVSPAITSNGQYWSLSVSKMLSDLFVVDGLR